MITNNKKFLWIPKKIDGKWYWLKEITVQTKTDLMSIGGNVTPVKTIKYIVD